MEKQLSYILMLPLEQIALRRLAIVLWNEPDILASIGKFREPTEYGDYQKKWRETIECEVSDKISKLQLPESLTKQMIQILKPIGLQILRWKVFHEAYFSLSKYFYPCEYLDVPILEKLCWTAAGRVDYRKTAEELVRCDVVDIVTRYKLACLYCLDHYIPEFWNELPQENKMYFYKEKDLSHIRLPLLQFCWPYILKGEQYKLDHMPGRSPRDPKTFHQHMFTCLSYTGNKTAAEYFFQKLSLEEREASLISITLHALESRIGVFIQYPWSFPKENITDVVLYLLSLLTPEQQIRIFSERPSDVLGCFLDWPWQDAFLDNADAMWTWMQCGDLERRARNYDTLLDKMQEKIQYSDYYLPSLYQNFFLRSPSDFRKHFADRECRFGTFFTELFNIQDTETINVILRNVDSGDRVRLASSKHIFKHFYNFISRGSVHVVEMCLREIGLSKEDKKRLKNAFMRFLRSDSGEIEWDTPKWKRFFEFLDETNTSVQSKRNLDDDALIEAKQLCCEKKKTLLSNQR